MFALTIFSFILNQPLKARKAGAFMQISSFSTGSLLSALNRKGSKPFGFNTGDPLSIHTHGLKTVKEIQELGRIKGYDGKPLNRNEQHVNKTSF